MKRGTVLRRHDACGIRAIVCHQEVKRKMKSVPHWRLSLSLLAVPNLAFAVPLKDFMDTSFIGGGVMLFVVGFFPQEWNLMANALVSFACAMQVQTFRKVNGYAFASTMCIGNMRSGMDSLCSWVLNRNPAALKKSFYYWGIILLFALGAGLGSLTLDLCGAKAIWLSCLLLAVSFCLMFLKEDVEEIKEDLEALEAKH